MSGVAAAQDRASVDAFLQGYEKAHVGNDIEWFVTHRDPTAIVRQPGAMYSYAEFMEMVEDLRKHPPKPWCTAFKFTTNKVEIIGERAIVDTHAHWVYPKGSPEKEDGCRSQFILVWKGGEWRLWRLEETVP